MVPSAFSSIPGPLPTRESIPIDDDNEGVGSCLFGKKRRKAQNASAVLASANVDDEDSVSSGSQRFRCLL